MGGGGHGLEDDGCPRGAPLSLCERCPDIPSSPEPLFLISLWQVHLPARGKWGPHTGDATAWRDALLSDVPVPGGV